MSLAGKELEKTIQGYWCKRFGLEPGDWTRSWTRVLGDEVFADTPELYLYRLGEMALLRLDPAKVDLVARPAEDDRVALDLDALIARGGAEHPIASAGAGLTLYLDPGDFRSAEAPEGIEARRLDGKADWPLIQSLLDDCSEEEVEDAEIFEDDPDAVVIGAMAGERLVGYAGFRYWEEEFADVGILTNPEFRRRGLGRFLVSELSAWCLDNGVVPMYRVDPENHGSRRIAEGLGYALWARIDVLKFEE